MTRITAHLSVEELRERYVSSVEARQSRHFHAIWLLAKGHTISEVAELTSFGRRWLHQLVVRYNADGPDVLGDLRRHNGARARVLKPDLLAKLKERLREAPEDGGLWTSGKVARFLAGELGIEKVSAQRGWEALKLCAYSIQMPRPRNPASATPEEAEAFKKSLRQPYPKKPRVILSGRLRSSPATSTGSA